MAMQVSMRVNCQPSHITGRNSVKIKNAIFLNMIHNTCNLRDTKLVMCIILVLSERADGLKHHLDIR